MHHLSQYLSIKSQILKAINEELLVAVFKIECLKSNKPILPLSKSVTVIQKSSKVSQQSYRNMSELTDNIMHEVALVSVNV